MWKRGLRSVEEGTVECGRVKRGLWSVEERTEECGRED